MYKHFFALCSQAIPRLLIACALLVAAGVRDARANLPGGGTGTGANVTLTTSGTTTTMSNGVVSIVIAQTSAQVTAINYTFNNTGSSQTLNLLSGNPNGGKLYWEHSNNQGLDFSGTYTVVADPTSNNGDYAEVSMLTRTQANMPMEVHFSMRRGSPGFYVAAIFIHSSAEGAFSLGECRDNIYAGSIFNWMSVDATRNKLMQVGGGTTAGVATAPVECSLWTSGLYQGRYEDKYKYSATFGDHRVWGWSSVTANGMTGKNVGLWNVSASTEYYNGGPLKPELMCHLGTTILNMINGNHYGMTTDNDWVAGETLADGTTPWSKVCGPYFIYCNNVANTITDPVQASQALYNDALAQGAAETSAWPYSWFSNQYYAGPAKRGTVTGKMVINDSYNPNASAANLWVGLIQQPITSNNTYDFQQWTKPYQFWTHTDASGNFTVPAVIAGSNYTLYAFGPGAAGTFMSQAQTGGSPPVLEDIPAVPFAVTVTGGATTPLGNVTWTPARVGPTVFEIGYPDRTARKFKHGDDYWVGDIGPSPTSPSPVWSKWLEFPFDFPSGLNYTVGASRWTTDWNFIQPVTYSTTGTWNNSSSTISFNLASKPATGTQASIYIGVASDYYTALIVTVNGTVLVSNGSTITATPNSLPSTGFVPSYQGSDPSIREFINGAFSDERITIPGTMLNAGTNAITISQRQVGGSYFADHAMYDYLRLELTGYVPPVPVSVTAFAGNNRNLVSWPVTPGATSYNLLRSTVSGSGYLPVATGIVGPVSGSGLTNATYADTSAVNGTTYYYVVRSVNPTGTSTANSPQSAGTTPSGAASTVAPVAPAAPVATIGNGSVTMSWGAVAGANYYTLRRSTLVDNGVGTKITLSTIPLTNSLTSTAYTDNSPTNGSLYSYTVSASNGVGESVVSVAAVATPVPPAPATAPPNLTITPGLQQVTLNWSAVADAIGYTVQVGTTQGGPYTYVTTVSSLSYTDTGLVDNTTYYYVVTAVNSGGTSATSNEVSATTAPVAPTGLTVTPGNTQATLNWTAPPGATTYQVQRATVSGGPYTILGSNVSGPSFTDTGLTNGTVYYYVVVAQHGVAASATSAEISVTPVATVPVAPTGLSLTVVNGQIVLKWTASTGATSYTIRRATGFSGAYGTLATGITATTYTDATEVAPNVYYYAVAAVNAGGTGANSTRVSGTLAPPHLTWNGSASSSTWDFATADWLNVGTSAIYADGALLTFDDTTTTTTVTISSAVTPGSLSFANATTNYTVGGSAISGGSGVTKIGAGGVTFNNVNTYTGITSITGGTVAVGSTGTGGSAVGGSVGTGAIQLNQGGAFRMASAGRNSISNAIQLAAGASATLSSANLSNTYSGALSGPANATLTLSGPFSANVSGSAQFSGFNGLIIIPSGSQLRFSNTGGANGNGGAAATFQVDGTLNSRNAAGAGGIVLGALSGSGKVQGQTSSVNGVIGNDIYFVGGNNFDSTFSGVIANGSGANVTSLTKVGAGTLTLAGANTYTGTTVITAGTLKITGSLTNTSGINVAAGSALDLNGGTISVAGAITNNGVIRLSGAASLSSTGSFTNNGFIDLINSLQTLPANFVNNGTVVDSSAVAVDSISMGADGVCTIVIPGYAGHTYQLVSTASLTALNWQNIGNSQSVPTSQAGSVAVTLTDPSATGGAKFYRVVVTPSP